MPWPLPRCATSSRCTPASTMLSTTTPASATTKRRQQPHGTTRWPGSSSTSKARHAAGAPPGRICPLAPLELHHDFVVGRLREHVQQAYAPCSKGRHRGEVARERLGVAARIDDVLHVRGLQPGAKLPADAAPR